MSTSKPLQLRFEDDGNVWMFEIDLANHQNHYYEGKRLMWVPSDVKDREDYYASHREVAVVRVCGDGSLGCGALLDNGWLIDAKGKGIDRTGACENDDPIFQRHGYADDIF